MSAMKVALLCTVCLSGCAYTVGAGTAAPYSAVLTGASPADAVEYGNRLAQCVEAYANLHRGEVGRAKRDLIRSGGVATGFGLATATLTGTFKAEDTKTWVGVGGSLITAAIGVYQIWRGAERDAADFVSEAAMVTSDYQAAIQTATDDTAKKKAVSDLILNAGGLQRKFAPYAGWSVTNPQCENGVSRPAPLPPPAPTTVPPNAPPPAPL